MVKSFHENVIQQFLQITLNHYYFIILPVRSCFGNRVLQNPLGTASFGYDTANGAEQVAVIDEPQLEEAIEAMSVDVDGGEEDKSGGAGSKYRKKDKKKKKKKVF